MTPRAYNALLFVSDFIRALDRLERWSGGRPAYPCAPWHRALREAEYEDSRRLLQARHAELDMDQRRVSYYERLECGSSEPRMNGQALRLVAAESDFVETRGRKRTLQPRAGELA